MQENLQLSYRSAGRNRQSAFGRPWFQFNQRLTGNDPTAASGPLPAPRSAILPTYPLTPDAADRPDEVLWFFLVERSKTPSEGEERL